MNRPLEPNGQTTTAAGPSHRLPSDFATQHSKRRIWPWFVAIAILGAIGYALYLGLWHGNGSSAAGAGKGMVSTPVVVAKSRKGNLNLYLTGLGTVTPFNNVTVRTRVDGAIDQIAFKEGQMVKEGELLVQIDPRPFQVQVEQAEGQLARDQAQLQNAQENVKRDQEAKDAISAQQLSTDIATEKQFEGAIKVDVATIDSAKLQLTYSKITAPISGRIGLKLVDQGNMVHATDSTGLAVITQLQPISLVFSLSEDTLQRVQKKSSAGSPLVIDALDRDLKTQLSSGTLSAIDNQIDPGSGTYRLKATFANQDNALFPNQFVNAHLLIDTLRDVILIPAAAVQQSPQTAFVYVVQQDEQGSTVDMRNITLGPTEGDETVVESGLSPDELVVTDGVDKLQQGAKVTLPKPGDTTRPGGGGGGGGHRHGAQASGTTAPAENPSK